MQMYLNSHSFIECIGPNYLLKPSRFVNGYNECYESSVFFVKIEALTSKALKDIPDYSILNSSQRPLANSRFL
jgi:hypothetical protein